MVLTSALVACGWEGGLSPLACFAGSFDMNACFDLAGCGAGLFAAGTTWAGWIGSLLGLENVQAIDRLEPSLAAPWARNVAWVLFAAAGLAVLTFVFYLKYQTHGSTRARMLLAGSRSLLLCTILLILAEPVLNVALVSKPRPLLWFVFDGSDSMNLADELPQSEAEKLRTATELSVESLGGTAAAPPSRLDYVKAWLQKKKENLLQELEKEYRLRAFVFDKAEGVRPLELSAREGEPTDGVLVAKNLSAKGEVTAIGSALLDLNRRRPGANLAGVVMVSDFDQNSGPAPLEAARQLGAPLFTVGVGPTSAVDLAVDLQAPLLMKRAEQSSLSALVRHNGLAGQSVTVVLTARALGGSSGLEGGLGKEVARQTLSLSGDSNTQAVSFPYLPTETGRFLLAARVEKLPGEVIEQNNVSEREVNIRDDFLRLMYVEYEPTWEWRFVKEVFHRDSLVGMRGFRTFLRSADPRVRHSSELFLETLTPQRADFFATDVIFLGDMPSATLSSRFCEMTKEFVSTFGGGLVVMAGPRFGPGALAGTPLADMLPVVVDPDARIRDQEFTMKRTADSEQYDFMQLGANPAENEKAWSNLGKLPWYQPVKRLHPSASVALAVHPTETCVDGKTPQPLIAVRRYGRGEVIYIAFNETWRLRKEYGELYYRKFWGQMIHRLGLSHTLGSQKRFVVRTDRQQYRPEEDVTLTVEAYDNNFEPLPEDRLPDRKLQAELLAPARSAADSATTQSIGVPQLKSGVFEARFPVYSPGEHRLRVTDPVTKEKVEVDFRVLNLSVEGRSAVRKVALQDALATASLGKSYDLTTVDQLPKDLAFTPKVETSVRVVPLWSTWLCFAWVVILMLVEWGARKLIHLP